MIRRIYTKTKNNIDFVIIDYDNIKKIKVFMDEKYIGTINIERCQLNEL